MSQPAQKTDPSSAPLLYRDDIGVIAKITLNNPKKYNLLSREMIAQLQHQFDQLAKDESIRVVILAANGNAFSAGHDLRELRVGEDETLPRAIFAECGQMMFTMTQLPQPVIASVQGITTAAGCELVANCDLAIASTEAVFAVSGVNVGLFCSTPGVALSRNVSRKSALEMLLTGDFINAAAALEKGLINRIAKPDELEESTLKFARRIACKPREVLALGKKSFYEQIDQGLGSAYATAREHMVGNLSLPSTIEGIDALIEKRKPAWR